MEAEGYWYKDGKIFDIRPKKHIHFICQYPSVIGLTPEIVNQTYQQFNEKQPFEGKARAELIKKATEYGWIRIRHYLKPDYWSFQFYGYKERLVDIVSLVRYLMDKAIMTYDDSIVITDFDSNTAEKYGFDQGGVRRFLADNEGLNREEFLLIDDFGDFITG